MHFCNLLNDKGTKLYTTLNYVRIKDTRVKRELLTCPGDGWRDVRSSRWDPPAEVLLKHSLQYIYIRTPTLASRRPYLRSQASKTRPANPSPPWLSLSLMRTHVTFQLVIVILHLLRIRCFLHWTFSKITCYVIFWKYRKIKFQNFGNLTDMEGYHSQNNYFRNAKETLLNWFWPDLHLCLLHITVVKMCTIWPNI